MSDRNVPDSDLQLLEEEVAWVREQVAQRQRIAAESVWRAEGEDYWNKHLHHIHPTGWTDGRAGAFQDGWVAAKRSLRG